MFSSRKIYLDYAAFTPISETARRAMAAAFAAAANPNSLHAPGVAARRVLDGARKRIADVLEAHSDEIIFVSGGTEGNNLAIQGVLPVAIASGIKKPHIISTTIEHASVKAPIEKLEKYGARVTWVAPDENGVVSAKDILAAIKKDTVLVSVMHANNETGAIQPVEEIGKGILRLKKDSKRTYPLFHIDACQTGNTRPLRVPPLHADLMTVNSTKLYGPPGAGILYVRRHTPLKALSVGGHHEFSIRPGTQNVPAQVGFAAALAEAQERHEEEWKRLGALRDFFINEVRRVVPNAVSNTNPNISVPNIINFSFPNIGGEELMLRLDGKGVAVATKSACSADEPDVSYVIQALGKGHYPESAIRFSLGRSTTKKDLEYVARAIGECLATMQKQ